jgi:hypothetical protein
MCRIGRTKKRVVGEVDKDNKDRRQGLEAQLGGRVAEVEQREEEHDSARGGSKHTHIRKQMSISWIQILPKKKKRNNVDNNRIIE